MRNFTYKGLILHKDVCYCESMLEQTLLTAAFSTKEAVHYQGLCVNDYDIYLWGSICTVL